jgi:regulator-associated protein of mTOR
VCISQLPQVVSAQRDFVSCGFFTEQIEIFDSWLKYNVSSASAPEQLPIVLQILLSQQHRLKALELLAKFLDFGPWAVSAALSVGIFPYVLKLITTQPKELRRLLTFIWAKILAVDKSCQAELAKDNGHVYFIHVLSDPDVDAVYKVYSAFVLASLVDNYPAGKEFAKQNHLISTCHMLLTVKTSGDYRNALLRQWCCICLGLSWQNYPEARWEGVRMVAHHSLIELVSDPVPEVRAAAIFALGTYIGCGQGNEADTEQTNKVDAEIVNALIKRYDIVFVVRKELVAALYNYVNQFLGQSLPGGRNNAGGGDTPDSTSSSGYASSSLRQSQSTSALTSVTSTTTTANSKAASPATSFRPSLIGGAAGAVAGHSLTRIQENVIAAQLASPKSPPPSSSSLAATATSARTSSPLVSLFFSKNVPGIRNATHSFRSE